MVQYPNINFFVKYQVRWSLNYYINPVQKLRRVKFWTGRLILPVCHFIQDLTLIIHVSYTVLFSHQLVVKKLILIIWINPLEKPVSFFIVYLFFEKYYVLIFLLRIKKFNFQVYTLTWLESPSFNVVKPDQLWQAPFRIEVT